MLIYETNLHIRIDGTDKVYDDVWQDSFDLADLKEKSALSNDSRLSLFNAN